MHYTIHISENATPALMLQVVEHLQFYYTKDTDSTSNMKFTYKATHKALGPLRSLAAAYAKLLNYCPSHPFQSIIV